MGEVTKVYTKGERLLKGRGERLLKGSTYVEDSVADPDPDPRDPHVFGPPGSGSFYHQAKIERKTLIPTIL